jgi:hypothetical protein
LENSFLSSGPSPIDSDGTISSPYHKADADTFRKILMLPE